jgi:cysteine desulfurase
MYGGGQEFGLRPGTLPTHQIVGLATALTLAARHRATDLAHVAELRHQFVARLRARLPIQVHGEGAAVSPYIVNLSIPGIGSDALINQVAHGLAIASGSACSSGTVEPSAVLRAMGIEGDLLYGAVRVSFDRTHSFNDVSSAADLMVAAVQRIRELSVQ